MVTVSHYTKDAVHLMGNIYYSKSQGRGLKRENGNHERRKPKMVTVSPQKF